ncbi:DNA-binding response regulator [Glycomyces sp. NPDC049804]|uniref:DNA-binding response regulator n=1 Tax=Glycomyces sp. NPDC049804 TaxID=3154363 RepID=UPI00341832FC
MVDDATALRASIASLLPALRFASVHRNVEELLDERPTADVVILDLHLANALQPSASQGIAAIRKVIEAGYRVCVYTQEERRFVLAACLAAGALGVVSKSSSLEDTELSFQAVADGELVAPPTVTGLIEVLARRGALTILTARQREVLAGRARGLTYAELSRFLFLSESTLRGYWRDLTDTVSRYLQETSPGDIERALGLGPGDLVDFWPVDPHQ